MLIGTNSHFISKKEIGLPPSGTKADKFPWQNEIQCKITFCTFKCSNMAHIFIHSMKYHIVKRINNLKFMTDKTAHKGVCHAIWSHVRLLRHMR